ncbi:acyltransferase [Gelidibacter sp. F63206]|nr:acyltransferase [Gelidibacter sp. F63206]MCK0115074.1 acyltransferase [Gelidibacter sp. F63206]
MIKSLINKICLRIYEIGKFLSQKNKYDSYRRKYNISENFRFNGDNILFYGEGKIHCGEGSYIGELSTIQSSKRCIVSIGCHCSISHNVRIYTQSRISDQDFSKSKENKLDNVTIGDYVWIGANVFINPGVTIGSNAIVGANTVVVKDIEPFTIVGGVPAKLIRRKKIDA